MKKRILSTLLVVTMLLSMVPFTAGAVAVNPDIAVHVVGQEWAGDILEVQALLTSASLNSNQATLTIAYEWDNSVLQLMAAEGTVELTDEENFGENIYNKIWNQTGLQSISGFDIVVGSGQKLGKLWSETSCMTAISSANRGYCVAAVTKGNTTANTPVDLKVMSLYFKLRPGKTTEDVNKTTLGFVFDPAVANSYAMTKKFGFTDGTDEYVYGQCYEHVWKPEMDTILASNVSFTFPGSDKEPAASVTEITGEQAIAITAPVAGATPQGTIAAGEGYTGSITWEPADASFGNDTVYTANVVLTAAATHKFAAGATAAVAGSTGVTGNTISADAAGNTLTFAATFPATAAATAGAPTITTEPTGGTITAGGSHTLTVGATSPDGGELSYQWFSKSSSADAVAIADSNKASIQVTPTETTSYYCVVTNTRNGTTATTASATVTVTVTPPAATPINSIALSLTAPVAGATATDATSDTTGVTVVSTTWTPDLTDNTFAYDTAYTAIIGVSAAEGYEIAADAVVTGLAGATYSNGNVSVTFAKTAVDTDIATVDTAIATIEGATYNELQANIADESAALAKATALVEALNVNHGTSVTVNAGTYIAPEAGIEATPAGTDGSYTFTATVTKGNVSKDTKDLTMTITATPYVAAGQTAAPLFDATTVIKTTATQATVNFTLTNDSELTAATYAVYSNAEGTVAAGYTVTANGTTLTLTHDTDVAPGNYYIAATVADKTESPKTMVTVNAYVAPVLDGTVTIAGETVVGSELTATVTDSTAGTFTYQWKSGTDNVGGNTNTYTTADSDVNKAITCVVTADGYTGSLTSNAITVKAAEVPVAPPVPSAPEGEATVEEPTDKTGKTSYEFSYKSVAEGNPVMGKVTLARVDGTQFDLETATTPDTQYKMVAAAETGYKFVKWARNTKARAASLNGDTITGTQAELAEYSAVFAAVDANAPKLSQMTISGADKSVLLRTDHGRDGFASDVNDYKVYLMPGRTGFTLDMAIQAAATATMSTVVTVNDEIITATPTTANGLTTYNYTKALTTTSGTVTVVLTDGDKTSTYTIVVATVSAKPQIVMDVTSDTTGVYDLAVNLENTIANEFTFSLKLDSTAFKGFTDKMSTELTAGDVKDAIAAQLDSAAFEVAKATYDADTNALVVAMVSKNDSYVDCTTKTKIATLKFLTVDNSAASMEDLAKLTIDSVNMSNSALTDQRFEGFIETTADGKTGLILINLPNEMFVAGFVNSLMKADVQAGIAAITILKDDVQVGNVIKPGADRSFALKLEQGTYKVKIELTNYVTTTVEVTGEADSIIGAIALVAGDVNGDGKVNTTDRGLLIGELFTSVTPGAACDIDGDGRVNGSDLGYMLANITAGT